MSGAASKFSSHWRRAGLNYLEMITVASNALRKVYKVCVHAGAGGVVRRTARGRDLRVQEPKRTQALASARVAFREFKYTDGKEGAPSAWRRARRVCARAVDGRITCASAVMFDSNPSLAVKSRY